MKKLFLFFSALILLFFLGNLVFAQDTPIVPEKKELLVGRVVNVISDKEEISQTQGSQDLTFRNQILEIKITKGTIKDRIVTAENDYYPLKNNQKVYLVYSIIEGQEEFSYPYPVRIPYMILLLIVFFLAIVFFAKKQGFKSFLTIILSLFIVFLFVLPQINKGQPPVLVALLAGFIIIIATLYFVYGWNKKTHAALLGTTTSLLLVYILSILFSALICLTGQANEQAIHIRFLLGDLIDLRGLLLATIIIGSIGALNDVAVDQSSTVFALKEAGSHLKFKELYNKAIVVGKDHLLATINTLVLAYIGIALPLLLVVGSFNDLPLIYILNNEIFAEEITKTLLASIGLIAVTPITTFFAVLLAFKQKKYKPTETKNINIE